MMTDEESVTDSDNLVRFPFDVIKISIEEAEENMPHWWHELVQSKLVRHLCTFAYLIATVSSSEPRLRNILIL
jgi:hypothetical protein